MLCRKKLVAVLTLTCIILLYVSASHLLSEDSKTIPSETENTPPNSINALDSLNDDPPHQVENAIRKYQQDTMKQLIHFQSDKNVEFRTTKPSDGLQQSKKIFVEESTPPVITSDGSRYIPHHRIVHFDLKGAPPKLSYLKEIFPMIKNAGATAILIEYEDMFPFWGPLRNVSAKNAYSQHDVQNINKWAAQNELMVIPLVQTFGHLEFILKLDEFKDLREVPLYPQSICPSQDRSWDVVQEVIDQVLSLHPEASWLHIGCDEVYQIGQCPICSQKILAANRDPNNNGQYQDGKTLFLQHVTRVGKYVRSKKNVVPIIWDDMLRTIPAHVLVDSELGQIVEPMVWVYVEDVDRFVDSLTWSNYGEVFPHIWAASAFKGAFGERLFGVNVQRHVGNNLAWLEVMRRETLSSGKLSFRGLVLTGWSRYDHFAVLCELLPVALPSLILNLVIVTQGAHDYEAAKKAHRILQCNNQKPLFTAQELRRNPQQWDAHRCRFSGSALLGLVSSYKMNRHEVEAAMSKITENDGWMSQYNVDHKFSSPWRVHESMKSIAYLPAALKTLEEQLATTLGQYFDHFTADEWIEQHIKPLQNQVDQLLSKAKNLTSKNIWPRRPLKSPAVKVPMENPLDQMPRG